MTPRQDDRPGASNQKRAAAAQKDKTASSFLMVRNIKEYQRLPGKKKSFPVGYHTLWQGADHLLSIDSRFGIEDYKRFYFADIQSIIVHKTVTGKIQNVILGVIMALFVLMAFTLDDGLLGLGGIMASCFLVFIGINLLRGPTCVTHLHTAVQHEKLPSLCRLKNARKVMNRLQPLIEDHQGHLSRETLGQNIITAQRSGTGSPAPKPSPAAVKPASSQRGVAHLLLFCLLLLDGLLILLNTHFHMKTLTLISILTSMGAGICVIIALVKQSQSNIPKALCNLTWAALGFVCISFVLGQVFTVIVYFQNPGIMGNQWKLIERVATMSFFENPLVSSLNMLSLGGAFCLGIPGLILVDKHRQKLKGAAGEPAQPLSANPPLRNP